MRVKEWKGGVVFLHEVAEGAAGRSWGVHVAELAGVPAPEDKRAASLLAMLERNGGPLGMTEAPLGELPLFAAAPAADPTPPDPLREALAGIDPDRLTPREALEAIYRIKSLLAVRDAAEEIPLPRC
jgi:DNA mismatch repair protein MutS